MSNCRIWSPMPRGTGAILVHQQLAANIPGYAVCPFNPKLEFFPPLLSHLRRPDANIVHAAADHGAMLATRGQALVVTFHGFTLDSALDEYSSFLQRLHSRTDLRWLIARALQKAAAVTAVSAFTAEMVESFFPLDRPVRVIENAVDTQMFRPNPRAAGEPESVRVLVSGKASRRKGTHLIAAIASNLAPGIEVVCTMSPEARRKWIGDLPNVRAIGRQSVDRMPQLYQQSDILLMPTAREGFGLAVAEAMATGIPVVASDSSTMPDLVEHGKGGYLCSLDEPEEFAHRINELAASPEVRLRMGAFNRDKAVERFSLETMVESYRSLFRELGGE